MGRDIGIVRDRSHRGGATAATAGGGVLPMPLAMGDSSDRVRERRHRMERLTPRNEGHGWTLRATAGS